MKIISHRGANRKAPQNTIPAFQISAQMQPDGFETDVHETADGELVICHNYTVDETSSGTGKISEMTLAELKRLDFGAYFGMDFIGTKIPTLDEFLEFVKSTDVEIINLELKPPKKDEKGLVQKTLDAVKRHGLTDKLLISSFDRRVLLETKRLDSSVKTAYLWPTNEKIPGQRKIPTLKMIKTSGVDFVHPITVLVNRAFVSLMHSLGIKVNVWTVNSAIDVKRLMLDGVDGIITDMPDRVKKIINR